MTRWASAGDGHSGCGEYRRAADRKPTPGRCSHHATALQKNATPASATRAPAARRAVLPAGHMWISPMAMPTPCRQPVAITKPDAVEEPALARGQLGAMRVAVEDGEEADEDRRDGPGSAALSVATTAPSRIAESAMPISTPGSGRPDQAHEAAERHHHRERTGNSQIAGAPSCAPQRPTAIMASTWSRPEIGCSKPVRKPAACPACTCAQAREGATSAPAARARHRLSREALHRFVTRSHRTPPRSISRALDRPERAERADGIAGQRLRPARPADLERPEGPRRRQDQEHEEQLPDLDPDVEQQQRPRDIRLRQAGGLQPAGEAEPVQQAEGERHDPG